VIDAMPAKPTVPPEASVREPAMDAGAYLRRPDGFLPERQRAAESGRHDGEGWPPIPPSLLP